MKRQQVKEKKKIEPNQAYTFFFQIIGEKSIRLLADILHVILSESKISKNHWLTWEDLVAFREKLGLNIELIARQLGKYLGMCVTLFEEIMWGNYGKPRRQLSKHIEPKEDKKHSNRFT